LNGSFDINLWNHFDVIGPRTNNHLEGFNAKLNKYFDYNKPHIYNFILALKDIETEVDKQIHDLQHGSVFNKKRSADILRDLQLKYLFTANITLYDFLSQVSYLFLDDNKQVTQPIVQLQQHDELLRQQKLIFDTIIK
jgi:hypothetical protein